MKLRRITSDQGVYCVTLVTDVRMNTVCDSEYIATT